MELKSSKSKNKIMNSSSALIAQKLKEIERREKKRAKSATVSKGGLFGRIIASALIAVTIAATCIYIEKQAQAAFDGKSQSRITMIYELYSSAIFVDKKKVIADVLLNRGVEENLSLQIAQTVVEESRKTNIPIQMYLAIMKTESTFRPTVVSQAYAKGIMQIQPGTWDAYVEKHNLPLTREHMFDPQANIMVASVILKELYDIYCGMGHEEPDVWHYVLAAYFAGPASLKNGIKGYHWRYIEKVKKHYNEFEALIVA
ncbi:MAG TPA: lytic transglycosylase domain-containing protein [Deltaproteobacteria bacterium]|nr:lytic transglycosylase domain-containing protein [Deltaproteobacteria bacterium]